MRIIVNLNWLENLILWTLIEEENHMDCQEKKEWVQENSTDSAKIGSMFLFSVLDELQIGAKHV